MKQGQGKVDAAVAKAGAVVNGWNVSGVPGDGAHYNGDWLVRAVAAQAGIYGNSPEEAMYPFTRKDSTGKTLDGSKAHVHVTFPGRPASAGERVLVGDHVRRQDASS